MRNSCPNSAPGAKRSVRKRVRCIQSKRVDLLPARQDPFLRKGMFYNVLDEDIRTTADESPWIEVQDTVTGQVFQRPRYMFGPILSDDTTSGRG